MNFSSSVKARKLPKHGKPIDMKEINFKVFLILILGLFFGANLSFAQEYHSKPTAIQNLLDEAAYIDHQLQNNISGESVAYKAATEKKRYINKLIKALKTEITVEQAANEYLPKQELNVMQRAVKYIDGSFTGTTPNRYIRNEMLFLIAY